jgi:CRISPR-associated protein (TIGR02584 family)
MSGGTLVFVAGGSPQIITETAYALLSGAAARTDVHILTTTTGLARIRRELLGRGGQWQRFLATYSRARRFRLSRASVHVLCDADGRPLEDVRSGPDNAAVADQVAAFVAERTREGCPPLHASIAGGRKTMGYSLAAAMMLYGRREDRLSHVLVHPPDLEGTDFFFPPRMRTGSLRFHRPDGTVVAVPARDIRVELADLPFPRLRALREWRAGETTAFTDLVNRLQSDLDALISPRLTIVPSQDLVLCAARRIPLPPLRFEIYALLAERRLRGCGNPGCAGCARCFLPEREIEADFRAALSARMRARQSPGVDVSRWNRRNFRPEISKINDELDRVLRGGSEPYRVVTRGPRGDKLYGLGLAPEAIEIGDADAPDP